MFITAVCVLFLVKLRWPKKRSIYDVKVEFLRKKSDVWPHKIFLRNKGSSFQTWRAGNNASTSEKLFSLKFSAKSVGNSSNICYFQEKSRNMPRDHKKWHCHLKMLRTVKSVHVLNFVSISSLYARNIANEHFSLKIAPEPELRIRKNLCKPLPAIQVYINWRIFPCKHVDHF